MLGDQHHGGYPEEQGPRGSPYILLSDPGLEVPCHFHYFAALQDQADSLSRTDAVVRFILY